MNIRRETVDDAFFIGEDVGNSILAGVRRRHASARRRRACLRLSRQEVRHPVPVSENGGEYLSGLGE